MSAINVSEALQKPAQHGLWEPGFESDLEALGDRACLALAYRLSLPAYTTDAAWTKVDLGVEVIDARGRKGKRRP